MNAKNHRKFEPPVRLQGARLATAGVVLCALLAGACAPPPPPPPPPPAEPAAPDPYQHVVKYQGETLGLIANWYTGRTQNWSRLQAANPALKPNRISIGDTVNIPAELLVRRDALPKSVVSKFLSGAVKPSESAAPTDPAVGDTAPLATSGGDAQIVPTPVPALDESAAGTEPANERIEEAVNAAPPPPVEDKKPAMDELDQLEKELESALAERGGQKQAAPPADKVPPVNTGAAPKTGEEAEREKLLDELLAQ